MRVLLIAGGWSNERAVSLSGAEQIHKALGRLGHEVRFCDAMLGFEDLMGAAQECDFAFINLHGAPGEDGLIQAMLDAVGCPYQGADPAGSFLALNKAVSKQLYRRAGLLTPEWVFWPSPPEDDVLPFDFPVFVKPNNGGSSLGMGVAANREELRGLINSIYAEGKEVLVEACTPGVELTCAVLGEEALPPILIRPLRSDVFFDYESKYEQGGAEEICPAPVSEDITAALMERSLIAHKALGLRGVSRSDFMLCDGELYLLETNTLPGMTPTSLLPKAAAAAGLDYAALIQRMMDIALGAA